MAQITIVIISGAILFILFMGIAVKKKEQSAELESLSQLMYLLLSQNDKDPNNIMFYLEKLARYNRMFVNLLRMGYLKNRGYVPIKSTRKQLTLFTSAVDTLYNNGSIRTAELLDDMEVIKGNDHQRAQKLANEIVNSVGIVFTIISMFMIVIYFLLPYSQIVFSYT